MSEHDDDFEVREEREPRHFWADNEVYDDYMPAIGVYGFAVYMGLCRYANKGRVVVTLATLCGQLDLGRRTVQQALGVLASKEVGLIRIEEQRGPDGTQLANAYVLRRLKSGDVQRPARGGEGAPHAPGEGAPHARGRVHHMHGGDAPDAGGSSLEGVHHMHGEGAPHAPKQDYVNKKAKNSKARAAASAEQDAAAAAAAAVFGAIISPTDALRLVETHPACIDHAEALVREASKPKIKDPAGMLVHLVTTGWVPPAVNGNGHGPADEEDMTGYLGGYCPTCAAITFGSCGHDEQPASSSRPRRRGRQPA